MKKIYFLALGLALSGSVFAQTNNSQSEAALTKHDNQSLITNKVFEKPALDLAKDNMVELWSDDFSDPSTWEMTNTSAPTPYDWVITTEQSDIPDAAAGLQQFLRVWYRQR